MPMVLRYLKKKIECLDKLVTSVLQTDDQDSSYILIDEAAIFLLTFNYIA